MDAVGDNKDHSWREDENKTNHDRGEVERGNAVDKEKEEALGFVGEAAAENEEAAERKQDDEEAAVHEVHAPR